MNGNMPALQHTVHLQKEVKSNPKTAQLLKKCATPKKAIVKKDVKSKVVAKKWLRWQQNFNSDNLAEFGAKSQ